MSRLTACVGCDAWERGLAIETEETQSQENAQKTRRVLQACPDCPKGRVDTCTGRTPPGTVRQDRCAPGTGAGSAGEGQLRTVLSLSAITGPGSKKELPVNRLGMWAP
jgi:hypothetical protein